MNYIELINRYWREVDAKGFTPTETNVYFKLLDICNQLDWMNPFPLSNARATSKMGVTENTLAACREKLVAKGLIRFKNGSRRKDIPMYCFPEKLDGEWRFPDVFTSNIEAKLEAKTEAKDSFTSNIEAKTEAKSRSTHYLDNKTKTYISANADSARARARGSSKEKDSLFSKAEMKRTERKGVKAADLVGFSPPTLEQARDFFINQNAPAKIADWKTEVMSFYSYYDSQGWVKGNGRKVSNWESLAIAWIIRREKEQKQSKEYEQTTSYRRNTSEDTFADEQAKLAKRIIARRNGSRSSPEGNSGVP